METTLAMKALYSVLAVVGAGLVAAAAIAILVRVLTLD